MKKKLIVPILLIIFSLFFLFSLKQVAYACSFSAPSSTNPNTKIKIVTFTIPDCDNGYCSAFVVYNSSGNEISCNFVSGGTNNTREITTPSSGDSITIKVEKRAADLNVALNNQSCSNKSSQTIYCSQAISLTGVTVADKSKPPSCSASFVEGQTNYLVINFQNAVGYSYYVIDPSGKKRNTGSISSDTDSVLIGENWPTGNYTIQIIKASAVKASCTSSNSYSGVSALDRLNEKALTNNDNLNSPFATFADLTSKTNKIVTASMGIAGGIAFILIVIGAFQIVLSAGNPDRVKAGKEMITAALAGLFLIIFSVFILKLIGADILQIPGFR